MFSGRKERFATLGMAGVEKQCYHIVCSSGMAGIPVIQKEEKGGGVRRLRTTRTPNSTSAADFM